MKVAITATITPSTMVRPNVFKYREVEKISAAVAREKVPDAVSYTHLVAIESGTTTLLQIDNSIEEASTILGAGSGYSFRRISLPMLRNAFFSGLVYSFVKAITAVSAIIFLVSPRWDLVTSKIYTLFDQAKYSQAAAFVTMMVVILLVFIGIFHLLAHFVSSVFS